MSEHYEYTIDGTTYYATGGRLYTKMDAEHDHTEVDNHNVHLVDGELCRLEWGGRVFSQVEVIRLGSDLDRAWKHIRVEDFDPVTPMRSVVPDAVNECPDCGSWAGSVEDDPECWSCGYGLDDLEVDE